MNTSPQTVKAWDLPTRLFKWGLVLLVFDAWVSNHYGASTPQWHVWNGYGILVLIVFRFLWGFSGGHTARFATFVRSPAFVLNYLGQSLKGRAPAYLGHNPLGACMILALLAALFIQASLGLFSSDPDRLVIEGPLAARVADSTVEWASRWHRIGFNLIAALAALHILANVTYQLVKKDPLITAMVTGVKPTGDYADAGEGVIGRPAMAILCLGLAVVLVFGAVMLAGGRPF